MSIERTINRVRSPGSRDAIARFMAANYPRYAEQSAISEELAADDDGLGPSLRRFSREKLAEIWTDRPAQLQVLRNILHREQRKLTMSELREIKQRMSGRPLRDIAVVAMSVIAGEKEVTQ